VQYEIDRSIHREWKAKEEGTGFPQAAAKVVAGPGRGARYGGYRMQQ
jgi:hypothetical protein